MLCISLNSMLHPAGPEALQAAGFRFKTAIANSTPDLSARDCTETIALVARNPGRVTAELIGSMPNLRVISSAGAGIDHIDVEAATAAGIPVVNNPGVGPRPVAEHIVGMMLALTKRISVADRRLRTLGWSMRRAFLNEEMGGELTNKTVGIIGLGAIGGHVARICRAGFDAEILVHSPSKSDGTLRAFEARRADSLLDLCSRADFVVPIVPYGKGTHHLIGPAELRAMRSSAFIINASRGPVIEQQALLAALTERRIAGAGIDVFDPEPPAADEPLYQLDNVVVTPHIAGLSVEATRELALSSAGQILDVIAGRRPRFLLNPDVWPVRRKQISEGGGNAEQSRAS
jgi:D-3-phosphoglycerate dehydrogenase